MGATNSHTCLNKSRSSDELSLRAAARYRVWKGSVGVITLKMFTMLLYLVLIVIAIRLTNLVNCIRLALPCHIEEPGRGNRPEHGQLELTATFRAQLGKGDPHEHIDDDESKGQAHHSDPHFPYQPCRACRNQ